MGWRLFFDSMTFVTRVWKEEREFLLDLPSINFLGVV